MNILSRLVLLNFLFYPQGSQQAVGWNLFRSIDGGEFGD